MPVRSAIEPRERLVPRHRTRPAPATPSLFDPPPAPPATDDRSIEGRFQLFHQANPQVYRELVARARQAKDAGHARVSMKLLFELVRWDQMIETRSLDFKLNNSFTSLYARLIATHEPDLADMFETRERRSA